ncbi:MAG: FG-GAP repeat protein [Bacteroidetes bacterium ADurb.Bin408]|nr:MAG: FG-GAP repeat protein [Bacteroidetes bacterium ADurb.Bin408]
MIRQYLTVFLLWVLSCNLMAQYHDYGFEKKFNVPVLDLTAQPLAMPWVGGENSCQLSAIDLNFDNIKDLVVFDRTGNRLKTFINNGAPNTIDYVYAPEYEQYFPPIHDWLFLVDYNNDGIEDIFTYSIAGMSVWRNDSDPVNGIHFTKVKEVLNSLQYESYQNLYVTEVELPGIADVNDDGCPDILVFHILGSYLNLHTNMSKIKYGHCDSLDFERTEHCWGDFYESENSADITLNINCSFSKTSEPMGKEILHVGSTILPLHLDSNGLMDLLIGDTDFPKLIAAFNGGSLQHAHLVQSDTNFPSGTTPVRLFSMPLPSYLDVNNDNLKDLVVSPFDANPYITESRQSLWLYTNNGTSAVPVFEFVKKNFLQDAMIDVGTGAYPVLFDLNGNGKLDLFVANFGFRDTSYYNNGFLYSDFISKISYYMNTGTVSQPAFTLITENFAGLDSLHLRAAYPAFGDIDNDGDIDLIIGEENGALLFLENIAGQGNPLSFAPPQHNYQAIDIGKFSTPQIIDLDGDGLLDLVIGDRRGRLNFFRNTGTLNNPSFNLITDTLGGVLVRDFNTSNYGYATPCFFKDSLGMFKLFAGSESGKIFYYDSISNNLNGTFTLKEQPLLMINEGIRTGVAVGNINNDQYVDMIIGNFSGGLNLYMGKEPELIGIRENEKYACLFKIYPNPASETVNIISYEPIREADYTIEIYNISGRKVFSNGFQPTLNISSLIKGLYILRMTHKTTGKSYNLKLMIY